MIPLESWYCRDCQATGLIHCSDPESCGGMKRRGVDLSGNVQWEVLTRETEVLVLSEKDKA